MIASLYICCKSFLHNGIDSDREVEMKLFTFGDLFDRVSKMSDNKFHLNNENFLDTVLLSDGTTILDIISNKRRIQQDCLILFLKAFKNCKKNKLTFSELLEYLELEDCNNCNALVVLNHIDDIPKNKQILSKYDEWVQFRRMYLGKYPKNTEYFLSECRKYYDKLVMHEDNIQSAKKVIETHSQSIVLYLGYLNDHLIDELKTSTYDFAGFLKYFASKYSIDKASFEGTKKSVFNFTFNMNGTPVNAYCEPHLKIYSDDAGNKKQHCRIYFQKPDTSDADCFIYVGYIGEHL